MHTISNTTVVFNKFMFLLHIPHLARTLNIVVVQEYLLGDIPGGPVFKNPPCNAGDMCLIPGRAAKI